jgi:cytochrome c oxidase cbb3-type subunit 1
VPILLKRPIWSHGLSLVGFWGLAFFYPLQGIHHFLYTPIPMFLQYGAVISTIAVELVVATVVINFFGTLGKKGSEFFTNLPIRYFYTGMVFYFITCTHKTPMRADSEIAFVALCREIYACVAAVC